MEYFLKVVTVALKILKISSIPLSLTTGQHINQTLLIGNQLLMLFLPRLVYKLNLYNLIGKKVKIFLLLFSWYIKMYTDNDKLTSLTGITIVSLGSDDVNVHGNSVLVLSMI